MTTTLPGPLRKEVRLADLKAGEVLVIVANPQLVTQWKCHLPDADITTVTQYLRGSPSDSHRLIIVDELYDISKQPLFARLRESKATIWSTGLQELPAELLYLQN